MTAEIQTLRGGRLILTTVSDRITRTDLDDSYEVIFTACNRSPLPVCCIYHVMPHVTVAPNLISVAVGHPSFLFKHPNLGLCMCVVTSSFIRTLIETAGQLDRRSTGRLHIVKTLEVAMQTVEQFFDAPACDQNAHGD